MRQQWVGHDRCCLPPPRRPISHAGGAKPMLAGPHCQSAPAATLWICGRREEAPPTTPQGQQQKKQSKAVFVQPTQDSKEAEKGRHPAEDRYQLEVSYRVQARDVTARLNNSGPPSFQINETISVKIDPDNSEHFVFNQTPVGASIAGMFLMGIAFMGFSLLRMQARRNRKRPL